MDVVHVVQEVAFSWDSRKALSNLKGHGVSFEAACEIFFDPFVQVSSPVLAEAKPGNRRLA